MSPRFALTVLGPMDVCRCGCAAVRHRDLSVGNGTPEARYIVFGGSCDGCQRCRNFRSRAAPVGGPL